MKNNKKIFTIIYFILFIIFMFIFSINFAQSIGDIYWNYSFSHAIRIGEIPYKDFNLISTPLFSFLMSIGLFIYDSSSTMILESTIISILIILVLYKLFNNKIKYVFPIFIIFFLIKIFIPTYNLLLLFLILLLILFEKENKSDLSIGILLGLIILSKHTIGFIITTISLLLVIKNKQRLEKRFLGILIPCIIFLIYLLITKSLYSFIDLCVLGLFGFAGNNNYIIKGYLIIILILFIINIILLIKYRKKKPIELIYSLGCISFIIPIIDMYHSLLCIFLYIICILLFILDNNKIKINNKYKKSISLFFTLLNIIMLILCYSLLTTKPNTRLNLPHFKYTYMDQKQIKIIRGVYNKYNEYNKNDKVMMIGKLSSLMDIASDNKITYFNVMLYGNWGYDIDKKVMDKFNNIHNTYIFVEEKQERVYGNQDYFYIYDYIESNYNKIDSIYNYNIYYKE